jgi:DNA-binding protein HU-beta
MTKAELIEKIAKDSGIPKTTAKIAFDSAIEGIKNGLKKRNSKVTLVGFGTFKTVYRKPVWAGIPRPARKSKSKGETRSLSNRAKPLPDPLSVSGVERLSSLP